MVRLLNWFTFFSLLDTCGECACVCVFLFEQMNAFHRISLVTHMFTLEFDCRTIRLERLKYCVCFEIVIQLSLCKTISAIKRKECIHDWDFQWLIHRGRHFLNSSFFHLDQKAKILFSINLMWDRDQENKKRIF